MIGSGTGVFNKLIAKVATEQEKENILKKLDGIYSESKYFSLLKDSVQTLFKKPK